MRFADIHIHALAGVDDGAATEADMRGMIDAGLSSALSALPGIGTLRRSPTTAARRRRRTAARQPMPCRAGMTLSSASATSYIIPTAAPSGSQKDFAAR